MSSRAGAASTHSRKIGSAKPCLPLRRSLAAASIFVPRPASYVWGDSYPDDVWRHVIPWHRVRSVSTIKVNPLDDDGCLSFGRQKRSMLRMLTVHPIAFLVGAFLVVTAAQSAERVSVPVD